ncbi:MAG: hypothetical protein GY940_15135 [bacterium]|nr:hypothetical protein [bacterium]
MKIIILLLLVTLVVLAGSVFLFPQVGDKVNPVRDNSILVDKIAAVVNQEIITLTDIDKAIRFYPLFRKQQETEDEFYEGVLEDLINYKVVYLEYRNEFLLREEDYVEVQTEAIERVGDLDEFMRHLELFDMEWKDFKVLVEEKVVYEKVLEKRLQGRIAIGFKEIEDFYNNEYLPIQRRMGLEPRSLIQMTSQIEHHLRLRSVQTRQRLADWLKELRGSYRIENKLKEEEEKS